MEFCSHLEDICLHGYGLGPYDQQDFSRVIEKLVDNKFRYFRLYTYKTENIWNTFSSWHELLILSKAYKSFKKIQKNYPFWESTLITC